MANLDHALHELEAARTLDREEFEERFLTDKAFFADYTWKFMGSSKGYNKGLIDGCWQHYLSERTPAHKNAWKPETAQPDFAESYHDHLRRMAGEEER